MKFYKGTSVIHDVCTKKNPQDKLGQNSMPAKTACCAVFNQPLNQTQKQVPNMLGLLKNMQYAHKQQLGGPRNALLRTSKAMFTVSLSESADIHCSTSTVAYKRSGCIYLSAA
ncbi:TPA: hypothetical protein ACH3X1_014887 [Trebouxia sp. C0004]